MIIGIDTGTKTGLAVWDPDTKKFLDIRTTTIVRAMFYVLDIHKSGIRLELRFEDARQIRWRGSPGRAQGAGSVKRDAAIWQEFCEHFHIPYQAVKPQKAGTKWTADRFKRTTKWFARTSEHGRDAGCLVFQANYSLFSTGATI